MMVTKKVAIFNVYYKIKLYICKKKEKFFIWERLIRLAMS